MGRTLASRQAHAEDLDLEPFLIDMRRRVNFDALPREPLVIWLKLDGHRPSYLLLRGTKPPYAIIIQAIRSPLA